MGKVLVSGIVLLAIAILLIRVPLAGGIIFVWLHLHQVLILQIGEGMGVHPPRGLHLQIGGTEINHLPIRMGLLKKLLKIWLLIVVSLATDSKHWDLLLIMVSRLCDRISICAINRYKNHCLHWLLGVRSDLLDDLNSKAVLVWLLVGGLDWIGFV